MVKKGSERVAKTVVKYDPDVIMLRIKALQNWSINKFIDATMKHAWIDTEFQRLTLEYGLGYGVIGRGYDKIKRLLYVWKSLSDEQKNLLLQDWIAEGLPEDLFWYLTQLNAQVESLRFQYTFTNISLAYEVELSPKPNEETFPEEEDYTTVTEIDFPIDAQYVQDQWFRHNIGYGVLNLDLTTLAYSLNRLCGMSTFNEAELSVDKSITIALTYLAELPPEANVTNVILLLFSFILPSDALSQTVSLTTSYNTLGSNDKTVNVILSYETQVS